MRLRRDRFAFTCLAFTCLSGVLLGQAAQPQADQTPPPEPAFLIQTETKLVLVDAVVTDKKGMYVPDLKMKDFHVSEDGKEQPIKSFSFEADPGPGVPERTHYLVLVFDNSTMTPQDQIRAKEAAGKFVDTNAGENRMMSIVNFGGTMQVAQNFTSDKERLKAVLSGVQISAVSANAGAGGGRAATVAADFAARDMLQTLRSLAKNLSSIPGRKILVLFTAGFKLTEEQMSEATATIDQCNKSNVAVYPVDVRGLVPGGSGGGPQPKALLQTPRSDRAGFVFQTVAFTPGFGLAPQVKGGGGGTTGGGVSAPSSSGGHSGSTSTSSPSTSSGNSGSRGSTPTNGNTSTASANGRGAAGGISPANAPSRALIPKIPESVTTNQQVMFMLASGTGGFVIHDDNDLLAGLEKIGKEQNQYYILGYTPPDSKEGSCHTLHVKVDRGGIEIRSRTGYCSAKPMDVLSGNPAVKTMEAKLTGSQAGPVKGSMTLPFFYTSPNIARVNLAMDISPSALKLEKKKGNTLESDVNVLGVAYTPQGTVAARFTDVLRLDYADKQDAEAAKGKPLHYENQFDIPSGKYTFKIVYSEGGDNFGKLEAPLEIDPYKAGDFALSGLALSKEYHRMQDLGSSIETAMVEDKTPLIASGLEIVPAGDATFTKSDLAILYFEMYEPALVTADPNNPTPMGFRMRVLDKKTGEQKTDTGLMRLDPPPAVGNPVVPFGAKMPVSGLPPGSYEIEVTAVDEANHTAQRTADFEIQ